MISISFLAILFLFFLIGVFSVTRSRRTTEDYLVAGKSVPPWLAGLSAVATNNSGFMFIGMIGVTYETGLSSIWIMLGWIAGDFMASLLAVRRIRSASENAPIHSFGGLLTYWHGEDYHGLRRLVGLLTVVFLGIYAAAQLKAGSKATSVLLDWEPSLGVVLGAVIVLIYSAAGGIRASIWTDAAQAVVMLLGMLLLMGAGLQMAGGISPALEQLAVTQSGYLNWLPNLGPLEALLFVAGWVFGGMGVIGQPHIVIRFISLDEVGHVNRMRFYYYTWFILFYGATIAVGMLSRLVLPEGDMFDAELALPMMAMQLLPDVLVGLMLAALFAATLSTADSLVLSCSAAISRDFIHKPQHSLWMTKLTTVGVLLFALGVALSGSEKVFTLVLDAWGMLASAFVPLMLIHVFGFRASQPLAIAMLVIGLSTFVLWNQAGLGSVLYSIAPGMLAGLLTYPVGRLIERQMSSGRDLGLESDGHSED